MMIRSIKEYDFEKIKRIYEQYYKDEFDFPDFVNHYLCVFSVIYNDEIVAVGGVRTIAESVIMTDKSASSRLKRAALLQMLEAHAFVASKDGYSQLHAFIQDENWKSQLIKRVNFKPCKGDALVLSLK